MQNAGTVPFQPGHEGINGIHKGVAFDWSVASPASAAGMSRSSFADRFKTIVGVSPLDYVTRCRMMRIRHALMQSDLAFATIAENNGYRSRASCNQTFKRVFGQAPQDVRGYEAPNFGHAYEDGRMTESAL